MARGHAVSHGCVMIMRGYIMALISLLIIPIIPSFSSSPHPSTTPDEQDALADLARRLMTLHGADKAGGLMAKQIERTEEQADAEAWRLHGVSQ